MLFLDDPVTSQPVAEKTFPIAWIYNLTIKAHDPNSEGSLFVEILPMSADKELYWKDGPNAIATNELYRAMSQVPELAAAFESILAAVKPTQAWIEARKLEIELEFNRQMKHVDPDA